MTVLYWFTHWWNQNIELLKQGTCAGNTHFSYPSHSTKRSGQLLNSKHFCIKSILKTQQNGISVFKQMSTNIWIDLLYNSSFRSATWSRNSFFSRMNTTLQSYWSVFLLEVGPSSESPLKSSISSSSFIFISRLQFNTLISNYDSEERYSTPSLSYV